MIGCKCDTLGIDSEIILNSRCKIHFDKYLQCPNCELDYIPFYDDQNNQDYCMGCLAKTYPKYWNIVNKVILE